MNIIVKTTGGGIFSTFTIAIQQILKEIENVDVIKNIYIELDKSRVFYSEGRTIGHVDNETGNPFDFVLDQQIIEPSYVLIANPIKTYDNHDLLFGTHELKKLQTICDKIKIKESVLNKVNPDIDVNTLGIHVRLTDMLEHHLDLHKGGSTQEYLDSIKNILNINSIKNIFVASDNVFSLEKIKEEYEIINNNVDNLNKTQFGGDYYEYQINNIHTENFWVDSFVDMISLSKCGLLLYKLSNLNNTSLFFSKTLYKFYKI